MEEAIHFWDNMDVLSLQIKSTFAETNGLDEALDARQGEPVSDKRSWFMSTSHTVVIGILPESIFVFYRVIVVLSMLA